MAYCKLYITEKEFDRLNYAEQLAYRFCPICGGFYHKEYMKTCKHREV